MSQKTIERKQLLKAAIGSLDVKAVDVREIIFEPGQETGQHRHPCPVFGYIAEGEAVLEIEGEVPQYLPEGSAFYETAGAVMARFDNASADVPLTFIAYYLLGESAELIEMLPETKS